MTWNRATANVISNALVAVVNGLIGILTISFLTRELGADKYGVWVLIGLVTNYLVVLDLGLNAATGRRLAARYGAGQTDGINRIVGTHLASSLGLGISIAAIAVIAAILFPRIFLVPVELQQDASSGVVLAGVSVSVYLLASVFTCLLWANERFDVVAAIEIPIQISKAAAIFVLIDGGSSLSQLALITLPANIVSGILAIIACRWLGILPRVRLGDCSWAEFNENWNLGSQLFTHQFVRNLSFLSGASVIGNRLEPDNVTSYSLARFLTNYAHSFVITTSQAAVARAALLHSGGEHEQQRQLLLVGGKYAFSCALLFLGGFISLGAPFIHLWQGGRHPEVVPLLIVLGVGEAMAMSQSVTNSVLLGMNRQPALIKLISCEILLTVTLGVVLAAAFGTIGVCLAIAFSSFAIRGLGQIWMGCRALDVRLRDYVSLAMLPAFIPAVPATLFIIASQSMIDIDSWWKLFLSGSLYGVVFAVMFFLFVYRRRKIDARVR